MLLLCGMLGCAIAVYLVPVLLGYGWSALSGQTPQMVGSPFVASRPDAGPISIEHFGTGVIEVGLSARIKDYLHSGTLPLWNPRQGLGQPFAAMGEGNPYWLPRVARALLPYSSEVFVAILVCAVSGVAMFGLLRVLGASVTASALTAAMWATNGSLSMHLARPNLFDQVAMLPVLFLGVALLMRDRTAWSFALAALLTGAFAIAGFPQIAAAGLITVAVFAVVNSFALCTANAARIRLTAMVAAATLIGVGLAAFYLFPLTENVLTGWEPRSVQHGYIPMPYSNMVSFFFPILAGQPLRNWMPGGYPDVTDWNNLYGHSTTLCLYLLCVGLVSLRAIPAQRRVAFLFFAGSGLAFYLKYVSLPPFSTFNHLPLIGTITPKHVNGLTAFLFVVAAGLVLDDLRRASLKRANWLFLGACAAGMLILVAGIARVHGSGPYLWHLALASVALTALLTGASVVAVRVAAGFPSLAQPKASALLLAVIVAEGQAYLLLGNHSEQFVEARIALAALILATGYAYAAGRPRLATAGAAACVLAYAIIVALPRIGLPDRVDLARPADYMKFLKGRDVDQYRTFGINADYSGVGQINDLSAAGPFAPLSYRHFVETVADPDTDGFHKSSAKFYLDRGNISVGSFPIAQYLAMKPVFDWLGVKYLVLEKKFFVDARRTDHHQLLAMLPTVYDDNAITVVESSPARSKVEFFPAIAVVSPGDETKAVRADPSLVQRAAVVSADSEIEPQAGGSPVELPLSLDAPNELQTSFTAPARGMLVVKQAFSPGWQALLDDKPAEVIPVAGIVQGVLIPEAGSHRLTLRYRTAGFRMGAAVSAISLLLVVAVGAAARWASQRKQRAAAA